MFNVMISESGHVSAFCGGDTLHHLTDTKSDIQRNCKHHAFIIIIEFGGSIKPSSLGFSQHFGGIQQVVTSYPRPNGWSSDHIVVSTIRCFNTGGIRDGD